MSLMYLLRKIKKTKIKDLKLLDDKLMILKEKKPAVWEKWREDNNLDITSELDLNDISYAFSHCLYHLIGNRVESLELEYCGCYGSCLCENCEMIPESQVGIMMQDIAQHITEENVLNQFIEKYGQKKETTIN